MDAKDFIRDTVTGNPVVLFMKGTAQFPQCGFSGRAIQILQACGVRNIVTVNVLEDDDVRQAIKEYSNWPTIPQLYVGGEFVGMTTLLVTTAGKAKELSRRPEIAITLIAKAEVRADASCMPEAPGMAVQKLLARTGLSMADMAVVKDHNPFAVNDAVFSKTLGYDWRKMNNNGSPLVWGHPQGPTLTRVVIEALEEAVDLGGGYVLVFGCAAGDVGMAAIFKVQ